MFDTDNLFLDHKGSVGREKKEKEQGQLTVKYKQHDGAKYVACSKSLVAVTGWEEKRVRLEIQRARDRKEK